MRNAQAFYFIAIQSAPRGDPLDTPRKGFLVRRGLFTRKTNIKRQDPAFSLRSRCYHNAPLPHTFATISMFPSVVSLEDTDLADPKFFSFSAFLLR